jgi:DNA-binding NarL/FixJ family response regulator
MAGYVPAQHTVFLVEDHDIVRRGVRDLLVAAKDIEVVGESGSARTAAQDILAKGADVMLLDLHLEDGTGVEVCRAVRAADPSVCGLLLTSASDDEALVSAVLAGAAGYLVKAVRSSDITWAIRQLGPGRSLIDAARLEDARRLARAGLDDVRPPLQTTEREVLELVITGHTDRDIAQALGRSLGEVTPQVAALVDRLRGALFGGGPRPIASSGRHRRSE